MAKKQRQINITIPLDRAATINYALEEARIKLEKALHFETQWDCTVFLSGFAKEKDRLELKYTYIPVKRQFN
jgi:hypothetical protein